MRIFANFLQDDWVAWCPGAEFALNNHVAAGIQLTPFFANSGQNPRMEVVPFEVPADAAPSARTLQRTTERFTDKMNIINEILHAQVTRARALAEDSANRRRDHGPIYKVGDQVWLDTRNMLLIRPSKKLSNKYDGPFKVTRIISSHATELELPKDWSHHNVFSNHLLRPRANDPLPGQHAPVPFPRNDDQGEIWDVERIENARLRRGRRLWLYIKWRNHPTCIWEPKESLDGAVRSVNAFFNRYPVHAGRVFWQEYVQALARRSLEGLPEISSSNASPDDPLDTSSDDSDSPSDDGDAPGDTPSRWPAQSVAPDPEPPAEAPAPIRTLRPRPARGEP